MSRIFITGGTGCIGAATIKRLVRYPQVERILIATRSSDTRLLNMWMGPKLDERIGFASADIGDTPSVTRLLQEFCPTHIIHLGALQSPDCDRFPEKGMGINVGGTMNLFHAASALATPLQRFVFASSAAVYGKRAMYREATVSESAVLAPPNLYGVWKVAGEHLAALFHEQTDVPTICLRLNTTFGPGRDRGKTSAPTVALKSIAMGASQGKTLAYRMPYQGRENYHYVEDVGDHFAGVAMEAFDGFGAFNIKGCTVPIPEFLETARSIATELGMGDFVDLGIADDAAPNLFICDLDDAAVGHAFPTLPRTSIPEGVRRSLVAFREQAEAGSLHC